MLVVFLGGRSAEDMKTRAEETNHRGWIFIEHWKERWGCASEAGLLRLCFLGPVFHIPLRHQSRSCSEGFPLLCALDFAVHRKREEGEQVPLRKEWRTRAANNLNCFVIVK